MTEPSQFTDSARSFESLEREMETLRIAFAGKIKEYEEENNELRARIADIEAELSRQVALTKIKTLALENKVQVVREMISFQLGAAILDALKSPAKVFGLPYRLWKIHLDAENRRIAKTQREEVVLKGPKFRELKEIFQKEGLSSVLNQLALLNLSPAVTAGTLGSLARELVSTEPQEAMNAAREAQRLDPKPYRAKWLAFRLFEQGYFTEPAELLSGPAAGGEFSASELKRVEEINVLFRLKAALPDIPPYRAATYVPREGSILYVAASALPYHTSGYATRTHELLVALKNAGASVTALTRPGYPWDRRDRQGDVSDGQGNRHWERTIFDGLEYFHRRSPSLDLPLDIYIRESARIIANCAEKRRIAAIHAASNYINALPALVAARSLGIPFAYEMRGLWNLSRASKISGYEQSERFRMEMDLEALVAMQADRVHVISAALGKIVQDWGVPSHRIHLLPNCVNPATIERARKAAGPKSKIFTIGYAGSLLPYEGLDILVKAITELKARGVKIHARIIGDGPSLQELRDLAGKNRVASQIDFLGKLPPDIARARLAETHTVVLPRRPDRVCDLIPPIKLAEARSLGLRIIASDVEAMRAELAGDARARVFPAGSVAHLADCIEADFRSFHEHGAALADSHLTGHTWNDFVPEILAVTTAACTE